MIGGSVRRTVLKEGYFLHKVVIITGASSGIGRGLSIWYLNNGARVALIGRDIIELDRIAREYPAQSLAIQAELTNDQNLIDMKLAVVEKFGRADILINCAGVIFPGDLQTSFPQDFDYLTDVHVRTPWILTQLFLDMLKKARGCIVNVSCDKGSRPEPGMVGYCMGKAGVEMFTQASALELAPIGVRLNAVAAGYVDSNMYRATGMTEPELDQLRKRIQSSIPLTRVAKIPEVCKTIIFLTSQK